MWPWYSPSRRTSGPSAQAPTQPTSSTVSERSARGAAGADAGVALELLEQPRRAAHVAGGAHAHGAGVLAAGLGVEPVVEGGDAVDLGRRQSEVRSPSRGAPPRAGSGTRPAGRAGCSRGRPGRAADSAPARPPRGWCRWPGSRSRSDPCRRPAVAQPPAIIGKIETSSSSSSGVSSICRCRTLRPLTKMMISPCRSSPSNTARRNGRP